MKLTPDQVAELNDQAPEAAVKSPASVARIVAVSFEDGVLFDAEGGEWPIVNVFDWMGDETDDPDEMVSGVATDVTGTKFVAFDMGDFEPASLH